MRNVIITALAVVAVASFTLTARAEDAKANWTKYCKNCHGETGKGDTKLGKMHKALDYSDAKNQAKLKDEDIMKALKEGVKVEDHQVMKPYGDKMSEDEMKDLVKFFRTFAAK